MLKYSLHQLLIFAIALCKILTMCFAQELAYWYLLHICSSDFFHDVKLFDTMSCGLHVLLLASQEDV
jgi:hypothetical protein